MIRALPLAALALLAACHSRSDEPKATHAWVRLPAVPGQPAAAYFTLTGGGRADTLEKIESALVSRIEMHASMAMAGGMMTMTPLTDVAVPARGGVTFAPGGRHAMLFGVDKAVTPGTAIPLRFGFRSGTVISAEAKTVAAGDDAPY